jgi:6-phosphogluconolactonase (cycloisomerase 2 family)
MAAIEGRWSHPTMIGGAMQQTTTNAVYVQTNEAERNRVIAFGRDADGALSELGAYETGGRGDGGPHLTSQGSVTLTGDGSHLLVTNAGSGDVSVLAVGADGLSLVETVATGPAPKSVAEREGVVYVLNTGRPSLVGFSLEDRRRLDERALTDVSDPAQVGLAPDGRSLVVTDRGTNAIVRFAVDDAGRLGPGAVSPSSGPTPYGFAFAGDTLVVTEAFGAAKGKAAASSYRLGDGAATPVSRSIGNGRSEICWAVATHDGRYAFTTNFADGAVSRWAIGDDGSLTLEDAAAGVAVEGRPGLRDEDLSADGRFLYALDADARRVFGWAVDAGGRLAPIGSWAELPTTAAGLAAA